MFFLSQLQKIKTMDVMGKRSGALKDLVASLGQKYPLITAIIVKTPQREELCISWGEVRSFEESQILLAKTLTDVSPCKVKTDEILLVRDVLDKQIVDTEGHKLIRVQDIQLARIDSRIRVIAVDVSGRAVFRRLGLPAVAERLTGRLSPRYIDWSNVDLIGSGVPAVKLKVSHDKLSLLHPADIADIVNELSPEHRAALLESLNKEVAADTVEEMNPPYQANVLSEMEPRKAAEILKEMEPDDAADLLADLPDEKAAELLSLIKKEEADELRELLQHPENSAGGIMTTEFVAIPANLTVQKAIERLRRLEPDAETIYYVYVVDKEEHLLGVLSLRKMIVSPPNTKISDIMNTNVISVNTAEEAEEATKLIAKYNFLAIPVVDVENHLQGIVTVDDAIDVVIPTAWKKRFPHIRS